VEMASVALRDVVASAMVDAQWAADVEGGDGTCVFRNDIPSDLVVLGEHDYLERVFVNILGNAGKFTARYLRNRPGEQVGPIVASAERDGAMVMVSIRDEGVGIRAADVHRVFDMYSQGEALSGLSQSEWYARGFGVGLAFCVATIEAHGGHVEVDRGRTHHMDEDPEHHGTCIVVALKTLPGG